eukprot:1865022-Pyramimonas_sp.AAC.1
MWPKPQRKRSSSRGIMTMVFLAISRSSAYTLEEPSAAYSLCSARSVEAKCTCRIIMDAAR